ISRRSAHVLLALVSIGLMAVLATQTVALAGTPAPIATRPAAGSTEYVRAQPVCSAPNPRAMRCFAMVQTRVAPSTRGARAVTVFPTSKHIGPAGGYTPAAIAKAYGLNLNLTPHATVGIVDAYNQSSVLADLNKFNDHNGLPHENLNGNSTFVVLNQSGKTS